jgi:hypothetical protein
MSGADRPAPASGKDVAVTCRIEAQVAPRVPRPRTASIACRDRALHFELHQTLNCHMSIKLKPVSEADLDALLSRGAPRGRTSKGGTLVENFLASGDVAATAQLSSTKERNSVALSAANHLRRTGGKVWVRKLGGGTGTELLLINLDKASAATRKAYADRPKVGRKPGS